jgi:hypothetical protein
VELPPGLSLPIAQMSSELATLNAINGVVEQLTTDPANTFNTLFEAPAVIANAYLNGQENVSLLDGIIQIPFLNGILAPLQTMTVDLNLAKLVDALGLGNLGLSNFDLTGLLSQVGLGDLTIGSLFNDLGLSSDGLGDLLKAGSNVTTLGGLLSLLHLNGLDIGSLDLTSILSGLGLDANVNLNDLTLDQILTAFGIDPTVSVGLGEFLTKLAATDPALAAFLGTGLGTELNDLGLLQGVLTGLNTALGTLLSPEGAALNSVLGLIAPGLTINNLLSLQSLETALNVEKMGDLLGGPSINDSLANILTALGVSDVTPSGLTIGGLLQDLGFAGSTGDLTLGELLGDLGNPILGLNVTDLLNNVSLGDLLGDLGLSNLPLNLGDLGDLTGLTLGGLLGDLGVGDLANITIDPFGGMITELIDVVPQQILAAI